MQGGPGLNATHSPTVRLGDLLGCCRIVITTTPTPRPPPFSECPGCHMPAPPEGSDASTPVFAWRLISPRVAAASCCYRPQLTSESYNRCICLMQSRSDACTVATSETGRSSGFFCCCFYFTSAGLDSWSENQTKYGERLKDIRQLQMTKFQRLWLKNLSEDTFISGWARN